jgi:hypothetical protein
MTTDTPANDLLAASARFSRQVGEMPFPEPSTDRTAEYLSALVLSHTRAVKLTRERFLELIASTRDATEVIRQLVGMFDDSQDG